MHVEPMLWWPLPDEPLRTLKHRFIARRLPPQAFSMIFNEQGQVTVFNVGYVIDRCVGNTGGLGGAFGFFWATGNALPFPECEPFKGSLALRGLGLLQKLQKMLPGQK